MKILVLSDSHGSVDNMARAVELTSPQLVLHLGDCWRDAEELRDLFPRLELIQVPGNCDLRPGEPLERQLEIEGKRILMCHGHTYHVKMGLLEAGYAARQAGADLFLFGHTHRPYCDWADTSLLVNPGSIGPYGHPAYALVRIENGELRADLYRLP